MEDTVPSCTASIERPMRYRTLNQYLRERFGERVQRVSVDAGFNCPNRDGRVAYGGCTFCNNDTFNFSPKIPLRDQIRQGIERAERRYGARKFILYFQAYTNTYAPVSVLKRIYDHVFLDDRIVALAIGTRADCLSDEVVDLLGTYTKTHEVWLELGVQTVHDETLARVNRAETAGLYEAWVRRLADTPLKVCVHLLMGLPGETLEMMRTTVRTVADWPIDGVKCHNLHIVRGTVLGVQYLRKPWPLMDMDEYVELLAELIAYLPPEVVLHRLVAESPPQDLIAPSWANDKAEVLRRLDALLEQRDWRQGCLRDTPKRDGVTE
jgi:hypothetical protein